MTNSRLQSIVNRIESLEEERKGLGSDLRDVYAEAKSGGYNVKALRRLIRERKEDSAAKAEVEAAMDAYRIELGMVAASVANGEKSFRQASKESGFSVGAIHRATVPLKENAASGTSTVPLKEDAASGTEDNLDIPAFLVRRTA
jgi:uncharacterized protein (UPF0335 family)